MPQSDEAIPLLRFRNTMGFIKTNDRDCFIPILGIRNNSLTLAAMFRQAHHEWLWEFFIGFSTKSAWHRRSCRNGNSFQ